MVIRPAAQNEYPQVIEFYYSGDIDVEYEGVGVKKFTLYEYLL